jgi:histidinol-phosphate aminotransferase
MSAEPRPGLRETSPYVSPQHDVAARLNTNESPHPLPESFFADLAEAVRELPLNRYPDGQMVRLREDLAARCGHTCEGTWVANGSNEVLTQLLLAYGGPGRRAVTFEPTYLLHSRVSKLTHTEHVAVSLGASFRLDQKAIAAAVAADPHVVFVCSPNNPTGNSQPIEAIETLSSLMPDALIVVDEAYIEFGGRSALPLIASHPNIAVVRTFSKAFALAGARIGYVLASPEVVEDIQRLRLPYNVSAITQAAGIAALKHEKDARGILDSIREERDRISAELASVEEMTVYPSDANFVLFIPPRPAGQIWQALLDRGVLIRDMSEVVPNALRVTAGSTHETDLFLKALKEVLAA